MKGTIKTIIKKPYKDRFFHELFVDIGEGKTKKYSCWQAHASELKEGAEVEYTEEQGKEWTDNEGMTHPGNWKMILPSKPGEQKSGFGGFRGKSKEEIESQIKTMTLAYSKDLIVAFVEAKVIKEPGEAQKWIADTFDTLYAKVKGE